MLERLSEQHFPEDEITDPSRRKIVKDLLFAGLGLTVANRRLDAAINARSGYALEEINVKVDSEINLAKSLLENGEASEFLKSKYLVCAFYYSDPFFKTIGREMLTEPAVKILKEIRNLITPEIRTAYQDYLEGRVSEKLGEQFYRQKQRPLSSIDFGKGVNHNDALDMFIEEGSEIQSMCRGIVVLAENGWEEKDPFSTSSPRGGNMVIIYNPESEEFYRYCHMREVIVTVGSIVIPGTKLGTVGNSGLNAIKKGHGRHLHLEINKFNDVTRQVKPVLASVLKSRIAAIE